MIQRQRPQRRLNILPPVIFLFLIFLVAVAGGYFGMSLFYNDSDEDAIPVIITVEYIITATPLPAKLTTPAPAGAAQVDLPADIVAEAAGADSAIEPADLGAQDVSLSSPPTAPAGGQIITTPNCIHHTLVSGDTPFGVALRYGVDFDAILEANDLTLAAATNLQVGDRLVVPLEGCLIDGAPLVPVQTSAAATPAPASTGTPVSATFEISATEGLGDITAESIRLRNLGDRVNISGWTLADSDGNSFTFVETLLFPQVEIVLYTRSGTSTADARFWGKEESVWQAGEELTLSDAQGNILQTLRIPGAPAAAPAE